MALPAGPAPMTRRRREVSHGLPSASAASPGEPGRRVRRPRSSTAFTPSLVSQDTPPILRVRCRIGAPAARCRRRRQDSEIVPAACTENRVEHHPHGADQRSPERRRGLPAQGRRAAAIEHGAENGTGAAEQGHPPVGARRPRGARQGGDVAESGSCAPMVVAQVSAPAAARLPVTIQAARPGRPAASAAPRRRSRRWPAPARHRRARPSRPRPAARDGGSGRSHYQDEECTQHRRPGPAGTEQDRGSDHGRGHGPEPGQRPRRPIRRPRAAGPRPGQEQVGLHGANVPGN